MEKKPGGYDRVVRSNSCPEVEQKREENKN